MCQNGSTDDIPQPCGMLLIHLLTDPSEPFVQVVPGQNCQAPVEFYLSDVISNTLFSLWHAHHAPSEHAGRAAGGLLCSADVALRHEGPARRRPVPAPSQAAGGVCAQSVCAGDSFAALSRPSSHAPTTQCLPLPAKSCLLLLIGEVQWSASPISFYQLVFSLAFDG